ncbi:MAG: hypothetical protein AAFQ96_10650, partial [Pseudomonadota bacterium]
RFFFFAAPGLSRSSFSLMTHSSLPDPRDHASAPAPSASVAAAAGTVTPEASNALDQALALDAGEPRARYYKARAIYQSGDKEGALDALVALSNDSPAGAPWLNVVAEEIGSLANELGVGVESLGLSAPLQNGSVDGQAAASPEIGGGPEALEAQIANERNPRRIRRIARSDLCF